MAKFKVNEERIPFCENHVSQFSVTKVELSKKRSHGFVKRIFLSPM